MLQSAGQFLLAWYNLPFTILILACVLLAALQWIGLGGDQEHDADHDVSHDIDHDVDAGVDHSIDHDLSHDVDHEVDHGADHDTSHDTGEHSGGFSVLAYIGMGKAPLMVVLLILFGTTGLVGWAFNGLVQGFFGIFPALALALTLPLALVTGGVTSARISRLIGRVLPPISTTAVTAKSLVGRQATVVSPWVDQRSGMVRLRDAGGTLISFSAVTRATEPIRRGEEVILVDYDPIKREYHIEKI